MSIYDQIAAKIIKEQELLMGPIAWDQAKKVSGFKVIDKKKNSVSIKDGIDGAGVIDNLVDVYGNLFGRAGREVCKEAVGALVAGLRPGQVPTSLK